MKRAWAARSLYPLVMLGAMLAAWAAMRTGWVSAAPAAAGLVAAVCAGAGERMATHRTDWTPRARELAADALWATLALLAGQGLLWGVSVWAAGALAGLGSGQLWPASWPLLAQALLYLVCVEFLGYWAHRLLHERALLWPVHRMHHAPPKLYWLNAFRLHPVDALLMTATTLCWAVLFGLSAEVVALGGAFSLAHLLIQHSNIGLDTRWLMPVMATAEFHRWHHVAALTPGERLVNYGHVFGFWDVLFGSWRRGVPPDDARMGAD